MPTFDQETGRHLLTPVDSDLAARTSRLRALGLADQPDPEFDVLARNLAMDAAEHVGASQLPYAMVNLVTHHQYFIGLHVPVTAPADSPLGSRTPQPEVSRTMSRDHGYCPHVVDRRRALPLGDVCSYPRFAANEVVDELGIRAYLGAPLLDPESGTVLGTVCVVDSEPRVWGQGGLDLIHRYGDEAMRVILRRGSEPS